MPALRNAQRHLAPTLLREPLGEKVRFFDRERQQDLGRDEEIVLVVALHDFTEEVTRLVLVDFFPEQLASIDDVSIADDEELDGDVAPFFMQSPNVGVFLFRRRDLLFRLHALDGADEIAIVGRHFETLRFGCAIHAVRQSVLQLFRFAAEKEHDVVNHVAILGACGEPDDARAETLVHVVVEAGARQSAFAVGDLEIAASQFELIGDELQQPARGPREKWTVEKISFFSIEAPRENDAWKVLRHRDFEVWIRFVVAKQNVVSRLMRLDQVVLEHDRFEFVVRGNEVDRFDLLHQRVAERIAIAFADDVGADAIAQIPRLPDVDHLSLGVLVEIHTGADGQLFDARFQALETIGHDWGSDPKTRP